MAAKKKTTKRKKVVSPVEDVTVSELEINRAGNGVWSNFKLFMMTVLICLIVFVVGYIYLWVRNYQNLQSESKLAQQRGEELEIVNQDFGTVKSKIQDQLSSCNALIAQGSGDFSKFEYCKQFIDWTKSLPVTVTK